MKRNEWLDKEDERAWRALQFMQNRLNAELARDLARTSGLSYSDYMVLVVLTDSPDEQVRLFELSKMLGWEKSRTSHQVARMVRRGLVLKEQCKADRRGALVSITPTGRQAIEAAAPGHVDAVRRLFVENLTSAEIKAIGAAAQKVLDALDRNE